MNEPIPLVNLRANYEPLKDEIQKAWAGILESMQLFLGPNVRSFEQNFAQYCMAKHAIGVSDGTSALLLALKAVGLQPGDEVITVSHTFIATSEAIVLAGGVPVFVDINPITCTMDVNKIEAAITPRTRVILPVHLYGQCADMDPILEIARQHNLFVIEDACQAHGAEYKGRRAGSMGHLAGFSFYFSKNLGAFGEGGMVTTSDDELATKVRMIRDHGSSKRYYHEMVGWNARLDELQAAVLNIKLPHLDTWNASRHKLAQLYNSQLGDLGVVVPEEMAYNRHVYHLYVIRVKDRDQLREQLNSQNIGTGIHYPVPIHLQKPYAQYVRPDTHLPVTESVVQEILSLPMYPELSEDQVGRVAAEIRKSVLAADLVRE